MHIACWINKATETYSEFVILIASPLQQWLRDTHINVTFYICCLSCINIMLPSMPLSSKWSHFFRLPPPKPHLHFSSTPYMPHFGDPNNICRMYKLVSSSACNFSPASSYSLPVRSKYTPQHPNSWTLSANVLCLMWQTMFHACIKHTTLWFCILQSSCLQRAETDKDSEPNGSYHFVFPHTI